MARSFPTVKRAAALAAALAVPAGAATFADIRPGARPMGMGMAYTAVADDGYALFYNPAGTAMGDFAQAGGSLGRFISPQGLASVISLNYTRPFPILPGAAVGAAYTGIQQFGTDDERNEVLFHFAHALRLPKLYLSRPLKAGGNFKILQAKYKKKSKVALGLDAGALLDSGKGWKLGLSIMDLTTGVELPAPVVNLGLSYRWARRATLAADLRVHGDATQFFPGIEVDFFSGLLKARAGKGIGLDTVKTVAFGLGANFSPVILDVAMSVPFNGINLRGGAYQLSAHYKFGAPSFYGRFVGSAAREAEALRSEISALESRRKDLESSARSAEAEKSGLDGQVRAREGRLEELEQQLRELDAALELKRYESGHAGPAVPAQPPVEAAPKPAAPKPAARPKARRASPAPARPSAGGFPKRHTVRPGDTLRRLADLYYGDATLWEAIYDANPEKVERGLPIEGESLVIPAPHKAR